MKKIISTAFVLTLLMTTVTSTSVYAQDESQPQTQTQTLIQRIIQRLGLNQQEVDTVVNEYRQERHSHMQARFEERLNDAVAQGALTESQKQALLEKHEEQFQEMQSLSWEERRQERSEHHQEMQAWAEANGIDLSQIMPMGQGEFSPGSRHHRGMGMGR